MSSSESEKIWVFDKKKKSGVWKHYKKNVRDPKNVLCIHCETEMNYSTSSMNYHLKNVHKIDASQSLPMPSTSKPFKIDGEPEKPKQATITEMLKMKPESSELVLAKHAAVDRISLNTLATSEELKKGWKARGLKIPNGRKEQAKMLKNFAAKLREQVKADLQERKKNGERFSMICDEWTSMRNKRYMGVELRLKNNKRCYLSLRRIVGKLPAPKVKEMLMKIASDFGLDFEKDIVGLTSDGAPLMVKSGRLLGSKKGRLIHQICQCHGLHLAICDVLYKKKSNQDDEDHDDDDHDDENNDDNNLDASEATESNDNEDSSDDDDEDDDDEDENSGKSNSLVFLVSRNAYILNVEKTSFSAYGVCLNENTNSQ